MLMVTDGPMQVTFPTDGTQWEDRDGDNYGDNPNGNNADAFPDDSSQWADSDGDGYGDRPIYLTAISSLTIQLNGAISDGDGYGQLMGTMVTSVQNFMVNLQYPSKRLSRYRQ